MVTTQGKMLKRGWSNLLDMSEYIVDFSLAYNWRSQ